MMFSLCKLLPFTFAIYIRHKLVYRFGEPHERSGSVTSPPGIRFNFGIGLLPDYRIEKNLLVADGIRFIQITMKMGLRTFILCAELNLMNKKLCRYLYTFRFIPI